MKKTLIITIIALLLVVGGITATMTFKSLGENGDAPVVQTNVPEFTEGSTPTATPEVEETEEASETLAPTEEAATEAPTEMPTQEPEATATPVAETAAPEVDYSKLSDDKLSEEIVTVITKRHATVKAMTEKERVVYTIYMFNQDGKGSLYNYLTGSHNSTAAYVSNALAKINATMSKELFDDFIDSSRIEVGSTSTLNKLVKSDYHFDIFDEEYAEIRKSENLTTLLASYIKNNLDDLK